jgi:DNA-binding HxlR family transcriptional regulator
VGFFICYKPLLKFNTADCSGCPISFSLDFIGDKWTLLILRDIVLQEKSTYGEFLSSKEKIATNILADRLAMLESNGFLDKKVGEDKKTKFVYSMTEKGIELIPVIMELIIWGSKFNPPGDADLLKKLEKDKVGTIKKYQNKIRESNQKKS